MIGQTIRLQVLAGKELEFEALVKRLMQDVTDNEPGTVYDVRRVRDKPRNYLYYISFPDQAAYDRYMEADYHTNMSPLAVAMLDGEPIFEDLEAF